MTEREIEVIKAFADNNMNVAETAKNTFAHRNTIEYHFSKIHRYTGLNPKNFHDLCILLQLAERREKAMYDIKRRDQFETVGGLKRLLEDIPEDTQITICGDDTCWFHIEHDRSVICLDNEDLEECYEEV